MGEGGGVGVVVGGTDCAQQILGERVSIWFRISKIWGRGVLLYVSQPIPHDPCLGVFDTFL